MVGLATKLPCQLAWQLASPARLTTPNFGAIRTEATIFDHRGRVLHDISPEGTLSYDYDVQGRMSFTAIDAVIPAVIGSIGTTADPVTAERVTRYSYDILGRLVSVTEDATPLDGTDDTQTDTGYSYDLLGRKRAQLTFAPGDTVPNSVTTSYLYDSLGRLDVMADSDGNGNTLASYDYTVRADGKRTSSIDQIWFDANDDGVQDASEVKTTTTSWTYDDAGRLTDEVLDHWDDAFDQTESFTYDLTGNRTQLERDKGSDGTIDEAITYAYDANDRLLDEVLDSIIDTDDTTTTYTYDQTQQTSKTVTRSSDQLPVSAQQFTYNLQGRMSTVVNEGYDASGTLTSRERTSYEYDGKSYRVKLTNETDAALDGNFTLDSITEFLANHGNKTGYAQTLRESKFDSNGNLTKQIDYTFGDDEIAQRVREFDAAGNVTSDQTLVFGHDGHGNVRVLYDLTGAATKIIQVFTFSAYGEMIALHNATVQSVAVSSRLSSTGYSGETFDTASQQQFLRARFYNPANGRFNRLDDFAGNNQDPQSLHKYAYVHADPIGITDPSGMFGVIGLVASIGIGLGNVATEVTAGTLILGILETGGRAGFQARDAGLVLIANGDYELGFMLFNLGNRVLVQVFAAIEAVDTAIGVAAGGVALTFAAWKLYRHAPEIADAVLNLGRKLRSRARGVSEAAETVVESSHKISVYHKGELVGGVSSSRELSTGAEREAVEALNRPGTVHEFQIPEDVLRRWEAEGKVRTLRDYDHTSGVTNYEYRFSPSIADEMNSYKVSI